MNTNLIWHDYHRYNHKSYNHSDIVTLPELGDFRIDEEFTFARSMVYSFSILFIFVGIVMIWKQNHETHYMKYKNSAPSQKKDEEKPKESEPVE